MSRFKSGWILVAVASLAIGVAIASLSPDAWWRTVSDRGRAVAAERLSKRAMPVRENNLAGKEPETAAILEQFAPLLRDSAQAAPVEDPKMRNQPIRIKTH